MMAHRTEQLTASDGTSLHLHLWEPAERKAWLVVCHGRGEHGARYAELAAQVAPLGVATAAVDRRGYGRSDGPRGTVRRFDDYLLDLRAVLDHLPPSDRWFLLGHSAGGLVGLRHLLSQSPPPTIHGLILSSPFIAKAEPVSGVKMALVRLLSALTPARPLPRSGVEHLTRDPQVRQALLEDPLAVPCATPRWFTEAVKAQRLVMREASRLTLPVLIQQGGDDRSASVEATRRLFEALGSQDKRLEVYEGLYHEVYHELPEDRRRVLSDLVGWLETRLRT